MTSVFWDAMFRRTHARLLAYARRRLPTPDHAADAVGEVFLRAYARRTQLGDTEHAVDGWLFGVLRNVVREMHRSAARERNRRPVDEIVAPAEPGERLLLAEDAAALRAAFARLSAGDQRMLRLYIWDELPAPQIAARLGMRPGAVRMALSRALSRLREKLGEHL